MRIRRALFLLQALLALASIAAAPAVAQAQVFTITVDVPANTPVEDSVYFHSGFNFVMPMRRVDADTWTISLRASDLVTPTCGGGDPQKCPWYDSASKTIRYAYTRGWGYLGAEALVDDLNTGHWPTTRQASFAAQTTRQDVVERWRWMPPTGTSIPDYIPELHPWQPRMNGAEFQAGVALADLWIEELKSLAGPTNVAARHGANASWVQLAPPWDYLEVQPLPVLSNVGVAVPAYQNEEDLRTHIREAKARGFKVMLNPQICCDVPIGQTFSEAWYQAWFDQYEAFLLYHFRIAAEEQVDSVVLYWSADHVNALPGTPGAPAWFETRWREMMAAVRATYAGPIGYQVWLGNPVDVCCATPHRKLLPILDLFDHFGVSLWAGLANGNEATQDQLEEAVATLFDRELDLMYAETGKPIILVHTAYGAFDGAAIGDKGVYEVANEVYFPEQDSQLAYDPIEQAMIYQAILREIAERPYVTGMYPFLYQYLALPLAPDYSVRGKPAEAVLAAWYGLATAPPPAQLEAGHSGAYYNPQRNGEGNYVEMLDDGTALVYTFSYRADGSGPAWFLGVGEVSGERIVIEDLLRPSGARFGPGFDSADIELAPAGALALEFGDCASSGEGGNVVFSGSPGLGYESLRTRAVRLSQIVDCGSVPNPQAGLSGSFYDPARNGEGLVVEWLTDGRVLAIFFTYDPTGKQFWAVGTAPAAGNSVTMEVLYPSASTRWGSQFKAQDIQLSTWGTFTLTWQGCNDLTFAYDSAVPGFGSAVRSYQRLTTLAGTSCP